MSDQELIEELTVQARNFREASGEVNPFLAHEYDLLTRAAQRLDQLTASLVAQSSS